MMFPLGDDVNLDAEVESAGRRKCLCKILGLLFVFLTFIGFLILITEPEPPPEKEENGCKELQEKKDPCDIELGEKTKDEIRSLIQQEIQANAKFCSKTSKVNPEHMRAIIKEEIKKQQKVSLKPDFASSSAGGMILSASPTWTEGYSYIYFLFIPIRSTAPAPSILLEPTRQPGDCWPMKGQEGSVVVQLAARANVVGFTVEHIDPAMSLSGGTPEAPKKFSVYGLENPDDPPPFQHLFGSYVYDNKRDEQSQYFRVQHVNRKSYLYIRLDVESNHGNDKYTCIYRFQVHGFIDRVYHCQNTA